MERRRTPEKWQKTVSVRTKRRENQANVQQQFKRNTREIRKESVLTSSTNDEETAEDDVVPNDETTELFLKEQFKNTVDQVVLTTVATKRRYCFEKNS